jgi:hypothetical protein
MNILTEWRYAVYSEEIFRRIVICGGMFSLKLFPESTAGALRKYILRKNEVEIITTGRKRDTGYLFKVRDSFIEKYYEPDARKRSRILTAEGAKEFKKRVYEYIKANSASQRISNNYRKEWYNRIYEDVLNDDQFSNYTRYVISDYKLFVCFTRILATFEHGVSIIPKKEEAEFCKEHGLLGHREISNGITFGYSYSREKVIILVSDFMKSEKSLIQILEYYNRREFEILIYSFRPDEIYEDNIRAKLMKESFTIAHFKFINNPYLNKFFGEY